MCFEVVNFVNEWLIGRYLILFDDGLYLCLNDLLFGCVIFRILSGLFEWMDNFRYWYEFI